MITNTSPHAEKAFNEFIDNNNDPVLLCGEIVPASVALKGTTELRNRIHSEWMRTLADELIDQPYEQEEALIEAGSAYQSQITPDLIRVVQQNLLRNIRTQADKYIDPAHDVNLIAAAQDAYQEAFAAARS